MTEFLPNIMVETWVVFLLYGVAVWRVSHILVKENSPFNVIAFIRGKVGVYQEDGKPAGNDIEGNPTFYTSTPLTIRNMVAGVFSCIWCMSVWVAILLVLGVLFTVHSNVHLYWIQNAFWAVFALSGIALIIDRIKNGE